MFFPFGLRGQTRTSLPLWPHCLILSFFLKIGDLPLLQRDSAALWAGRSIRITSTCCTRILPTIIIVSVWSYGVNNALKAIVRNGSCPASYALPGRVKPESFSGLCCTSATAAPLEAGAGCSC